MNLINKIKDIIPDDINKNLLKLFIFTFFGIFFELLGISLVLPAITIVTKGDYEFNLGLGIDDELNNFISNLNSSELFVFPLLILLLIYTTKGFYLLFLRFYNGKFSYIFVRKLSNNIYKNYLYQDQLFHLGRNSSDLIRIGTTEIPFFLKNIIMPSIVIFMEIFVLMGIIFILLSVETISTLIVLSIIIFISLTYYLMISGKIKKWGQERLFHEGKKIQNLTQGLHGIKTVKIFNQEENFLNKFNFHVEASAKSNLYATLISQTPAILIEFVIVCLIIIFMIFNVKSSMNVAEYFPTMALFAAAAFRIMPSMGRLIVNFQMIKYALPAVNKLHKEFPLKSEPHQPLKSKIKINFKDQIQIHNLSFKYPNNQENLLQDLNFKIKFGEIVGIMGKTGEGKSTIVDLICGLLQPQKGRILIDDCDIQQNLKSWQQQIGYVPQNVYLLDDTIKENIIFGSKNNDDTKKNLNNAIKLAQLENLITNLPDGLETLVGDRGARLSGGQIQRIGIARAIMNNAQVLIFDESTSALDIDTEKKLINDIYKLKSKKTLIIISHRRNILNQCDSIYNLKNKNLILESKR